MDASFISVVICTHNPREDYLRRVLDALRAQKLPAEQWELLLIDNASKDPLDLKWDLSWHSRARHIREDELGLTPARLRGIKESNGELIVFVDDDNVLAPDYLSVANRIAAEFPHIATWSGRIEPDFEVAPPAFVRRFWSYLALDHVPHSFWANMVDDWCRVPCGAGMCVRTSIAKDYHAALTNHPLRRALDRKGDSLASCGDTDLALHACDSGFGYGRFAELKVTHLIPARRVKLSYLLALEESLAASTQILRYCREGVLPVVPSGSRRWLGRFRRLVTMRPLDRSIINARIRGAETALVQIHAALDRSGQ
jgi:glycosyltransferase involved in cell wall biosynthesis